MYVSNPSQRFMLLVAGLLMLSAPAFAAVNGDLHDVHRLPGNNEFQSTIEARCTICHTRDRVDAAIGQQVDLDALMQRMIERGAILNERDQKVLGTFWGSPLKGGETLPAEPR